MNGPSSQRLLVEAITDTLFHPIDHYASCRLVSSRRNDWPCVFPSLLLFGYIATCRPTGRTLVFQVNAPYLHGANRTGSMLGGTLSRSSHSSLRARLLFPLSTGGQFIDDQNVLDAMSATVQSIGLTALEAVSRDADADTHLSSTCSSVSSVASAATCSNFAPYCSAYTILGLAASGSTHDAPLFFFSSLIILSF